MSHDALFELGMGSVQLNASQREETFAAPAPTAWAGAARAIRMDDPSYRAGLAALAASALFRVERRTGGNSAKALTLRAGSAVVPTGS